jgi:LmbE family N-acetylglucosaminyl deacetylase
MIRAIRAYRPDLVLTHRPNDYHPDHRTTGQLVQDAAYLLTVPALCPDVPHLPRDPVIAYLSDDFTRPYPFEPTVVVDVAPAWDAKVAMLHAHASQFYEWLPYNGGYAPRSPPGTGRAAPGSPSGWPALGAAGRPPPRPDRRAVRPGARAGAAPGRGLRGERVRRPPGRRGPAPAVPVRPGRRG